LYHGNQTKKFHFVIGVPNHSICEGDVTTAVCVAQLCAKSVLSFFCSVKHVSVTIVSKSLMCIYSGVIVYDTGRWDPLSVASSKKKRKVQEDSDSEEDEHEGVRLCESCDQLMDR